MTFIRYHTADGDAPLMVQTSAFNLSMGPVTHKDGSVAFGINRQDSPGLHELVNGVEGQVLNAILTRPVTDMPDWKRAQLGQQQPDCLIRPMADGDRIYIPTAVDCVTYNWDGTEKLANVWESGRYQLILRLSNIFVGQSGHKYAFYPQWKVSQVRYDARRELAAFNSELPFLFSDEEERPSIVPQGEPMPQFCVESVSQYVADSCGKLCVSRLSQQADRKSVV